MEGQGLLSSRMGCLQGLSSAGKPRGGLMMSLSTLSRKRWGEGGELSILRFPVIMNHPLSEWPFLCLKSLFTSLGARVKKSHLI